MWINFLRKYGPIPRNDNMYDESIQRASKRSKYAPILFKHPFEKIVLDCFQTRSSDSVILTGTAGDGKTHLCRKVWEKLGGDSDLWASDESLISTELEDGSSLHVIRDLSSWVPPLGETWLDHPEKLEIAISIAQTIVGGVSEERFLIAGNDGQIVEAMRRLLADAPGVQELKKLASGIEDMLVDDRSEDENLRLRLFNLSRGDSGVVFSAACDAFLSHPGWDEFRSECPEGVKCPVIMNLDLLSTEIVRGRIRTLVKLCDCNGLHLPIRQILILLTNAVLGHPDGKDRLLSANDLPKVRDSGRLAAGCIYSNIFGGNLTERRREAITVFNYFGRFHIGYETTNRIDNLLIFGDSDHFLKKLHDELIGGDEFYFQDTTFQQARRGYVEAADENAEATEAFLQELIRYRRAMFFRIPPGKENEYGLWDLSVFRFAGDYADGVLAAFKAGNIPSSKILKRLVIGLNRVFTGMLLDAGDNVYLAVSGGQSNSTVSRIYLGEISVRRNRGERVALFYNPDSDRVSLRVEFSNTDFEMLELNLVRFEFLSRVAEDGALPASFSRECHEDILAFKNRLIVKWESLYEGEWDDEAVVLRLLSSEAGRPSTSEVEMKI